MVPLRKKAAFHVRSTTGGSDHGLLARINRLSTVEGMGFYGLGGCEKGSCIDMGNGSSTGEGNGDIRGSNVLGKFGNGQNIVTASGKESGSNSAAQIFNRNPDGFKTIVWLLRNTWPGIGSETDLMAKVGHNASQSSGGRGFGAFNESGPVWRECQVKRH